MDRVGCTREIALIARTLLQNRNRLRESEGPDGIQRRAVNALGAISDRLLSGGANFVLPLASRDPTYEATCLSLRATLESWTSDALWRLIDSEDVRGPRHGPALTAHFIASNTALLAWTSIAKALLVGSASIVRLPSDAPLVELWTQEFLAEIKIADPELGKLVTLLKWPSHESVLTQSLCNAAGTILAYGSDRTIAQIKQQTPENKIFIGFSHRVSFGIVLADADTTAAAARQALDIAIFDQQGCLSPHCIFVEGDPKMVSRFADDLAGALDTVRHLLPVRSVTDANHIREQASLARLAPGVTLRQAPDLRWTVVSSTAPMFEIGGTRGFVSVRPLNWEELKSSLEEQGLSTKLQGASIATHREDRYAESARTLESLGVGYICRPGYLQRPPFSWREDGQAPLAVLC